MLIVQLLNTLISRCEPVILDATVPFDGPLTFDAPVTLDATVGRLEPFDEVTILDATFCD